MLNPKIRLLLALVSFLLGGYGVITNDYLGFVLIAASAFLGYGYFKYGTVWLAFRAVSAGHVEKAAELLRQVERPASLSAQERAYFELASGFVCASRAQNADAERHLRLALDNQLRTDNDRALAEAVLAQLLTARDEVAEARSLLERAKARSCRPAIAERIRTLHEQLPRPGPD
jgi:hypothetical protein